MAEEQDIQENTEAQAEEQQEQVQDQEQQETQAEEQEQAEQPEASAEEELEEDEPVAPKVKPEIPGADLEVDIVLEPEAASTETNEFGYYADEDDSEEESSDSDDDLDLADLPIGDVTIELGKDARYGATGKRKSAVARVILKPGNGTYTVNGKELNDYFPRSVLQRNIRQALEVVGYSDKIDVVARIHGGGVSAQAGALRHGISRALLVAQPNLRGELKNRGFLTRDARVKERKKAGLKKARKRPQFSKR